MLQVNQSSGDTVLFNLEQDGDRLRWERLSTDPAFQSTITGASILWGGRQYASPRPQRFKAISYEYVVIHSRDKSRVTGEQIIVQADAIRTVLTVWRGQNGSMKVEMERAGRRVHTPGQAGMAREHAGLPDVERNPDHTAGHALAGKRAT